MSFQLVSDQGLSFLGFTALSVKMSVRGLAHNNLFIFDGTNYDLWKIYVLNILRRMYPDMERFLDMGFSSPKDPQNLSLEEEKNSCLDALASHVFSIVVSNVVTSSIMPLGALMNYGQSLKTNMMCPTLLRMIVLLPLPAVMSSHLHPVIVASCG